LRRAADPAEGDRSAEDGVMRAVRGIVAALAVVLSTAALAQPAGGADKPVPAAADSGRVHTYAGQWSIALPAGWSWHDEVTLPFAANGDAAVRTMLDGEELPEGAAAIGFFPPGRLDAIGLTYTADAVALFAAFAAIADGVVAPAPLGGTGRRLALAAPYPFSPAPPPASAHLVVYEADGAAFAFVVVANDPAAFLDVARAIVTSTVLLAPIP